MWEWLFIHFLSVKNKQKAKLGMVARICNPCTQELSPEGQKAKATSATNKQVPGNSGAIRDLIPEKAKWNKV